MSEYIPWPFRSFRGNINVKVDLPNYATKKDLKVWHTLTLEVLQTFCKFLKTNLASLKTEVDNLNIDKLVPVPADLSKVM